MTSGWGQVTQGYNTISIDGTTDPGREPQVTSEPLVVSTSNKDHHDRCENRHLSRLDDVNEIGLETLQNRTSNIQER